MLFLLEYFFRELKELKPNVLLLAFLVCLLLATCLLFTFLPFYFFTFLPLINRLVSSSSSENFSTRLDNV